MANDSNVMNTTEPDTDLAAEVLWCVQHIEMILNQGKLGEKKTKEARISRKLLKNPDTLLLKKRQAMRNSCGDYRAKNDHLEEQGGQHRGSNQGSRGDMPT